MQFTFDERLSLYRPLMEDPDGENLAKAGAGTRFEGATDDLLRAWRQIGNARGLPHLVATATPTMFHGFFTSQQSQQEKILRGIMNRLGSTAIPEELRSRLAAVIADLETEVRQLRSGVSPSQLGLDAEILWASLLELEPFVLAVIESERRAYTSLYFDYECFLARCVEVRLKKWPKPTSRIGEGLKEFFGEETWSRCWEDAPVRAARHARDAFAHRGGRANDETLSFGSLLRVEEGEIRIMASHTNTLYATLYERVTEFLTARPNS